MLVRKKETVLGKRKKSEEKRKRSIPPASIDDTKHILRYVFRQYDEICHRRNRFQAAENVKSDKMYISMLCSVCAGFSTRKHVCARLPTPKEKGAVMKLRLIKRIWTCALQRFVSVFKLLVANVMMRGVPIRQCGCGLVVNLTQITVGWYRSRVHLGDNRQDHRGLHFWISLIIIAASLARKNSKTYALTA